MFVTSYVRVTARNPYNLVRATLNGLESCMTPEDVALSVASPLKRFWVSHVREKIKVTLVRSVIGTKKDHRATVRGLGLGKVNSSRVLVDTPEVRGMIRKVDYLVSVSEA